MQKVVIVNLNGTAWHLEEAAFASLGAYLDGAGRQLAGNPDREEIVADLEQAIADKFGRYLDAHKNVVTSADMARILDEMGPVRDERSDAESPTSGASTSDTSQPAEATAGADSTRHEPDALRPGGSSGAAKRLYRMLDSGVIGGVCAGMAAFADLDVAVVRVVVTLAAIAELGLLHTPLILLAYLALMFVIPVADTSEERAAARGIPFSAQMLIDEAKMNFSRMGEQNWKQTRKNWKQQRRWERAYMRHQSQRTWNATWGATWPPQGPIYGSATTAGMATPFLSALNIVLFLAASYAALSLALTGAIKGWPLPQGIPLWLGIVGVLIAYNLAVTPVRLARRASYHTLVGPMRATVAALDGVTSAIVIAALVWTAYHYMPELLDWVRRFPEAAQNVIASFRP